MNRSLRMVGLTGAIIASSLAAEAQSVVKLVSEGDAIAGNGNVTVIDNIAVNNLGGWMAEVRTDFSNTSANKVVLLNGQTLLTKGQPLAGTGGGTLSKFDSMTLNDAGNAAFNLKLNGVSSTTDEGVFWNDKLVIQKGDACGAVGVGAGTTYANFDEVRINENNQILVMTRIEDPTISLNIERLLVILDLDANGNLLSETYVEATGAPFNQGNGAGIGDFIANPQHFSFNDNGATMFAVRLDTGSGADDEAIAIDNVAIVEEGLPSPIAGRNWASLGTPEMGLNNSGDWVLSVGVDGATVDNSVIVKNNTLFAQENDPMPGAPGFTIVSFGSGPVEIGNNGDIMWYAKWSDPINATDSGLLVNNTLIIEEGVTMVGTNVITKLVGLIDGYHLSSEGNVLIFEGSLDNGKDGVFRVTLATGPGGQAGTAICFGDALTGSCPCGNVGTSDTGCSHSGGVGAGLMGQGSNSLGAGNLTFQGVQLPSSRIALLVTGSSLSSNAFGDGMLCIGSGWTALKAKISSGGGSASWTTADLANGTFGAGQTSYFQILFRDPGGPCGAGFGSSSAFQVDFVL